MLDTWTHARELITKSMMHELENDYRDNGHYVNPIFLMAHSGARGGVEQMRQLAGMRGLMAKPCGEIIETPIKANFREGLTVLEYFSSTHGARKGLADTALKTADCGYLTRKLADICQNVVITTHDCGTTQGHHQGRDLPRRKGRSQPGRLDPRPRQPDQHRQPDHRRSDRPGKRPDHDRRRPQDRGDGPGEDPGPQPDDLRSASSAFAGCATAWTSRPAPWSKKGMAVGHHRRPEHRRAGHAVHDADVPHRRHGRPRRRRERDPHAPGGPRPVHPHEGRHATTGKNVVLTRNGEILILDPKGRELEKYNVPAGATLLVDENEEVEVGRVLCQWDPHSIPILAEVGGKVRFEDCIEGGTIRSERKRRGHLRRTVIEHKGDLHPQIILEDATGKILDFYYLPERATIEVQEGQQISAGTLLAKTPREVSGTQDITGGLPRVTEIFEARKPKDPAVIAEIDGKVELLGEKKRGKRTIVVRSDDGIEGEHLVSHGKHLRVHANDRVRAGDALVGGPLVPHDILRICGAEAVQQYLIREIQNVYRSQRVEIDDKHIEIIVAQMLRKVRVEDVGDTTMLPGIVIDKFEFRGANEQLMECVKITEQGDTDFQIGDIVPAATLEEVNAQIEAAGRSRPRRPSPSRPPPAPSCLGITKAAVQSESFISAASFQETTKVLTEAALAGKVDHLVGLKENVILGHLIPAGTGFHTHQEAEVRIRPEALQELRAEKERIASARLGSLDRGRPAAPAAPAAGEQP